MRTQKGFTLLETLIALAIFAVPEMINLMISGRFIVEEGVEVKAPAAAAKK